MLVWVVFLVSIRTLWIDQWWMISVGDRWWSINQTNPNQTTPNQPNQTIPDQPDIPNQPTTSIHHFPPSTSTPPTPPPRCSRAYEARHMDASRSLVRWMSWSLLLPRLDVVGVVVGFPVDWSRLVGWFCSCFVYKYKAPNCWLWNFTWKKNSIRRKKKHDSVRSEIGWKPKENIGQWTLEWRWTVCKVAECQLDLDRLLFRSPNGSRRSIQVAKCSTPILMEPPRFTPWIYVRSSRPDAWNCCVTWEMWTRRCEMPNFEMRGTGAKSSHTWQFHFMVLWKRFIFQTYTVSFLENWCIFPSTLLQVRLIRREYSCGCECPCLPLHSTGAATCWIDGGAYSLALFLGVDVGGRV